MSLDDQLLGLALTSQTINIKCGLLLDMSTTSFSKLVIDELKSSEVGLGERYFESLLLLIDTLKIRQPFK